MDLTNTMSRTFKDQYEYSSYDKNEKNFISRSMSRAQTMRYENTLTYMHDWGKHSLTAMVGQTTEEYNYYYIGGSGASIANPTDNNWYLNQATETAPKPATRQPEPACSRCSDVCTTPTTTAT